MAIKASAPAAVAWRASATMCSREVPVTPATTGVRPAVSLVTPGTGGYVSPPFPDFAQPLAERQAQARELLAEAGFGGDQQLTVPLIYDSQDENRKIAIALEAMWQAVGVNTEGAGMEFRAVLQKMRAGDFALARTAVFAVFDDPYAFMQVFGSRNPRNMSGYSSDAFDGQIAAANATGDPVRRMALLQEAESTLMADQPLLPIYWYAGRMLISERVAGWEDAPLGTPMSRYLSVRDR